MMDDRLCNLLHEDWILVMSPNGETAEVSILEAFRRAPEIRSLAGELPTQDMAVLRFLLAILHTVFARYDLEGRAQPISSPDDAFERWKELWDRGSFPDKVIEGYLLAHEERFWLIHPQFPFYQVPGITVATDYTAAKLNGELMESGNKARLFPQRTGRSRNELTLSEAARWLLHVNAFDDTSAKPKDKRVKTESPGAGWLGKLGLIAAVGDTLFETLLLNLVFLKDGEDELWGEERPVWELPIVRSAERVPVAMPSNQSELLTIQSRRLLLKLEDGFVVGYSLLGGDHFPKENAFSEQMTLWRNTAKKKDDPPEHVPRRHDPSKQLWREFPSLLGLGSGGRRPGIVGWLSALRRRELIPSMHFRFQTAGMSYGDKDFKVDDVLGDGLAFSADLLAGIGEAWIGRIAEEIATISRLVDELGWLAQDTAKATGSRDGYTSRDVAKEQAYYRVDEPFRIWLEQIDPVEDEIDEACDTWWRTARGIVRGHGRELVGQAGPQAFAGRYVSEKSGGKTLVERFYSAPQAYERFLRRTSTRDSLLGTRKGGSGDGK